MVYLFRYTLHDHSKVWGHVATTSPWTFLFWNGICTDVNRQQTLVLCSNSMLSLQSRFIKL